MTLYSEAVARKDYIGLGTDSNNGGPCPFTRDVVASTPSGFVEPCLPTPAESPPTGPGWWHEIKHDGYRLMARRDPVGIRLLTKRALFPGG
jgi:ATP-dependent DNA ligase